VLPSTSTQSNICRREFTLTVDEIKKQLPSRNKVSLAMDLGTSPNKLAVMLGVAYYMDAHRALRKLQFALDKVDSQLFSLFQS